MAEKLLILTLVAVSAYAFWRRFGTVFHTIMASRKDASFHLAPLGPRVWDFFREVICQAKVIRERPLPGLAHAFVFWGFCAFALVTLNHFALGLGIPFLHRDQGFLGPFYFGLAFAFSLVVAVSITGLAVRRLVVRPKWLGAKVSWESGLIALLILTLMVTYAADYWQRPDAVSASAKALWWLHTLALLVFLPLVPHTKHLHLLLSPVTVFLSRGGFSRIPLLEGDEDFGLDTGKDVTQLAALQAYSCVECGRCQEHCPAHNTGKLLNPKEIALGFRGYLNEHGAGAEQPLIGVHLSEEAIFQCTTCGACEYQCPVGIEHVPLIVGLRRGAVNTGRWEDEYGGQLFLKLERNGNPLGMAALERDRFLQKHALPLFDGTQEYCLWLGCMGSYDPKGREIVLALVEVLRHLGVTYGVLKKEKCTGDSARRLGNDLAFQQLAEFNIGQMKTAKVRKLLSICPHCVRTIGEDWKELGAEFEIEHHSVFLARRQAELPAAGGSIGRVVYHDPCYLGRYQDVYDQPRAVISAGGTLMEPGRSRERSFCCGAGGGLVFLGEETGSRVSHERARELADTGADVVAAACPFCNTMFQDALAAVRPEGAPQLLDVAQIAAARLPRSLS
ncbi:MAG TPA: (Fe-S)-binding protein [Paludibaculum sp.]|jgi:Fe-S oxidoreductase